MFDAMPNFRGPSWKSCKTGAPFAHSRRGMTVHYLTR